jgi:hypothetical protein
MGHPINYPVFIEFGEIVYHDRPYTDVQLAVPRDRDFYDRSHEKVRIDDVLRDQPGRPIVICGSRRSGKTSLLYLVYHRLGGEHADHYLPVRIPWDGPKTAWALAREIAQATRSAVSTPEPLLEGQVVNRQAFTEELRRSVTLAADRRIVILIDEFDSILAEADASDRADILALAEVLMDTPGLPVTLVITATQAPAVFTRAEHIHLRPFPRRDLDDMVNGLLSGSRMIDPRDMGRLYELSGGWPFYSKVLLSCYVQLPAERASFDQALADAVARDDVEQTVHNIYDYHMDEYEKAVVLALTDRDGYLAASEWASLGVSVQTAIDNLVERDILALDHSGDGIRFRIGFLHAWFHNWAWFDVEKEKYRLL